MLSQVPELDILLKKVSLLDTCSMSVPNLLTIDLARATRISSRFLKLSISAVDDGGNDNFVTRTKPHKIVLNIWNIL